MGSQARTTRAPRAKAARVAGARFCATTCRLKAALDRHGVARHHPREDDLGHGSLGLPGSRCRALPLGEQRDLLGPQREKSVVAENPARGLAAQDVRRADEAGDELGRRRFVDLGRRADLGNPPALEDGEPVAHGERLLLVVSDEDEGDSDVLLDRLELDLHLMAELQVQGAERFVEQQDLRAIDQGARQRDPLPLAAGELRRPPVGEAGELDEGEHLVGQPPAFGATDAAHHRAVGDVLAHGEVGKERIVLEDGIDVALVGRLGRDIRAVEENPAGRGQLEPRHQAQAGRLAGTRRAEEGEELAVGDREIDARDRLDFAEPLGDALELDGDQAAVTVRR